MFASAILMVTSIEAAVPVILIAAVLEGAAPGVPDSIIEIKAP